MAESTIWKDIVDLRAAMLRVDKRIKDDGKGHAFMGNQWTGSDTHVDETPTRHR